MESTPQPPSTKRSPRDRRLGLLITCLLLAVIFACGQLGLLNSRTSLLPVQIAPSQSADYTRWEAQQFQQVDPRLGTQIIVENREATLPPQVALIPTDLLTNAAATGAVLQSTLTLPASETASQTASHTPMPSIASATPAPTTPTSTLTAASTATAAATAIVSPVATSTETIADIIASASPTETPVPTHTHTADVSATATTGYTPPATSAAPPTALFSAAPASGTAPLTVIFTNLSSGAINSYVWSFGDGGGVSNLYQPAYTYVNPGNYTVTLMVSGAGGSSVYSLTIVVVAAPTLVPTIQPPPLPTNTSVPQITLAAPTRTPSQTPLPSSTFTPSNTRTPINTPAITLVRTFVIPTQTFTPVPTLTPSFTPTPTCTLPLVGNGLRGEYFNTDAFSQSRLIRIDGQIGFNWATGTPDSQITNADNFSARWVGFLQPCTTETYTLTLTVNDYGHLWLNGQRIITLNNSGTATATVALTAGNRYPLMLDFKEFGGDAYVLLSWSSPTIAQTLIPAVHFSHNASGSMFCNDSGTGLTGNYYDNPDFTALFATRIDPTINFDWGTGAPITGMGADTYSVEWQGVLKACSTDTYLIYTEVDDGVRLWLDNVLVIDRLSPADTAQDVVIVNFTQGQDIGIRLQMYNDLAYGKVRLQWETSTQPKTFIPASQLYPAPPLMPLP